MTGSEGSRNGPVSAVSAVFQMYPTPCSFIHRNCRVMTRLRRRRHRGRLRRLKASCVLFIATDLFITLAIYFVVDAFMLSRLESGGARTLPVSYDASPGVLKRVMDNVNGLFLPGGDKDISDSARWAIEYARKLNEEGDFFPTWGTCLGWEWMAQALAGNDTILRDGFDGMNVTRPVGILPGAGNSRMLSGFSASFLGKVSTEPLAANNHNKGVPPEDFAASELASMFRLLAVDSDRVGRKCVSAVEAFGWPMYGVQFHPEKSQFQWGLDPDGTAHYVVNHSVEAIQLSQGLANFFVSETRRNQHVLTDVMHWEPLLFQNRDVTSGSPTTGQVYYFLPGDEEEQYWAVDYAQEA